MTAASIASERASTFRRAACPTFTVVGLPDSTGRESKERVLSAIKNAGYQ